MSVPGTLDVAFTDHRKQVVNESLLVCLLLKCFLIFELMIDRAV